MVKFAQSTARAEHPSPSVAWLQRNELTLQDFIRLQELAFRHALCGHGPPLREIAKEAYGEVPASVWGEREVTVRVERASPARLYAVRDRKIDCGR